MAIKLDSKDIGILVHLWQEGARICEIDGNEDDNRRRIYRMRRAGLCGCSPQQGWGGHRAHIWGINPAGIDAINLSESEYAGRWREDDFEMVYPPNKQDECLCSVGNEPYHDPWCPAAKSAIG